MPLSPSPYPLSPLSLIFFRSCLGPLPCTLHIAPCALCLALRLWHLLADRCSYVHDLVDAAGNAVLDEHGKPRVLDKCAYKHSHERLSLPPSLIPKPSKPSKQSKPTAKPITKSMAAAAAAKTSAIPSMPIVKRDTSAVPYATVTKSVTKSTLPVGLPVGLPMVPAVPVAANDPVAVPATVPATNPATVPTAASTKVGAPYIYRSTSSATRADACKEVVLATTEQESLLQGSRHVDPTHLSSPDRMSAPPLTKAAAAAARNACKTGVPVGPVSRRPLFLEPMPQPVFRPLFQLFLPLSLPLSLPVPRSVDIKRTSSTLPFFCELRLPQSKTAPQILPQIPQIQEGMQKGMQQPQGLSSGPELALLSQRHGNDLAAFLLMVSMLYAVDGDMAAVCTPLAADLCFDRMVPENDPSTTLQCKECREQCKECRAAEEGMDASPHSPLSTRSPQSFQSSQSPQSIEDGLEDFAAFRLISSVVGHVDDDICIASSSFLADLCFRS